MSQQASNFNEESLLDWPYVVPTALVQRIADVAAIERVESTPAYWMAWQQQRVGELLAHVKATNPWWDEWLGGGAGDVDKVRATLEKWHSVPVLTREQLRASVEATPNPPLAEGEDPPTPCATRGTTGESVMLLRSAQATRIAAHQFHADHMRHGRPLHLVRAVIGDVAPDHQGAHTWMPAVGELNESVILLRNAPKFSIAQHLDWLRTGMIGQLTVATDFLASLVNYAGTEQENDAKNGKSPIRVAHILTAGAPVSPELRAATKAVLGADLYDRYVCEEAGPLATQARGAHLKTAADGPTAYNIAMTNVLLEVLNPDGTEKRVQSL
jgi:phenylacetate-coenzyme A ligase PaaK-like adenylate-forming protein